jgi:hypothetical protein
MTAAMPEAPEVTIGADIQSPDPRQAIKAPLVSPYFFLIRRILGAHGG